MTAPGIIAFTGGTGFVGQAVCDAIERQGLEARALARRIPDDRRTGIEWVQGDLANRDALARLIDGAACVIHIAGLTNTPDPAQFDTVNVDGTRNVVAACKAAGVKRLVLVSSLSARKPELSRYGASKAKAEEVVQASGLDWTIVRPPAVYGPRDTEMFELFRGAKWGFVPLPPGGATSIIHADDLAELLVCLAGPASSQSGDTIRRRLFEPDDGREGGWAHKELARAIGKAVRRPVFAPHIPERWLYKAAALDRKFRGDKAKLTEDRVGYMVHPNWVSRFDRDVPETVWTPRISGEQGLAATARWYREQGWL
ncbi:NAD(P)-dependent oxidoreductase [Qipengyuania oceanensis]|uniref:NAD-dependent epimerase/dehydratase family protein n=1 Tax=Qipengyuania oceanensis TaxID=1463597 RepID=UPI00301CCC55